MAKINVNLEAFYGYSCGCHGHGSKETIEMEVNEVELEALQKLGTKEVSCEAVVNAIESGEKELISLHERLEEKFYYMVEWFAFFGEHCNCICTGQFLTGIGFISLYNFHHFCFDCF